MQNPILTHDLDIYAIVIFVLFGLASFNFSYYLFSRWLSNSKLSILQVNVFVKFGIVIAGCFLIPVHWLFQASLFAYILSFPVGLGIGAVSVYFEKWIMRRSLRKNASDSFTNRPIFSETSSPNEHKIKPINLFISSQEPVRRSIGLKKISDNKNMSMDWLSLISLAILEEIIFRGFLLTIFKELVYPYPLKVIGIIITILVFGLSHLLNGNAQMKSKVFFASLVTVASLLLNTMLPAIISHLYLNHIAYKLSKNSSLNKLVSRELYL